ncbi:MAG: methyl-accepting chemotaxis protein [Gammaproteobacteria bacterium]
MFGRKKSAGDQARAELNREFDHLKAQQGTLLRTQPVAVCGADGMFKSVSDPFAALLGCVPADLCGTPLVSLLAPESATPWREAWSSLLGGRPAAGEFKFTARDGGRWLKLSVSPVAASEGASVAEVICFAADVTSLRNELDDTRVELKVRTDIMNITSIVSEADKKGDILNCNDKFIEVSKYPREELIGHGHNTTRHPDMPKAVFKEMWNTIGHGKIFRGVVKNRAKDGTPYYVDAVIAPILGENGKPKKYLGVRYDITETEIERMNARGVLGAIDESFGYIEFDLVGNVTSANRNFLDLTGYRAEEVVGRHHRMFMPAEEANTEAYRQFWVDLAAGKPQSSVYRRVSKSGDSIYIQATYAPVKDEMDRVFKIVKIATDVTAQKKYEMAVADILRATADVMQSVRSGDLRREMAGQYEGEFAVLQDAVNGTIAQLRDIVGKIREGALSINTAAGEVSKGNTDLSSRTESQAASLEETAASMEEMTSSVQQNADNSRRANQLAASARDQAKEGGQVVSRAVEAMSAINDSSRRISDIIGVIDEIAFQTNLLALNAAVEAARAGEQGRGFAVVASEVRNLAQRSASAAKEIKALINDSVHKVSEGTRLVDESGQTLGEIVTAVAKVSDIVSEIALASEEQASGIAQVNTAVTQMDQMTQQNAALVEEAAAASESMDQESRSLLEVVQFFTTDGGSAAVARPVERRGAGRPWSGNDARPAAKAAPAARPAKQVAAAGGGGDEAWDEF